MLICKCKPNTKDTFVIKDQLSQIRFNYECDTVYIGFYGACFLRTSQITNQIFGPYKNPILAIGFYEHRNLRTEFFGPLRVRKSRCTLYLNLYGWPSSPCAATTSSLNYFLLRMC